MMEQLKSLVRLAELIRQRNAVDLDLAILLGRPATSGNLGEFIAAAVFDIELAPTGVNPGNDGVFRSGPFKGKTVNVKLYSEDAGLLDIGPHPADFYLVLTGPKPKTSAGPRTLLRRIDSVYLFDMEPLRLDLRSRGVGVGVASSVRRAVWDSARIYPQPPNTALPLDPDQLTMLELFQSTALDGRHSGEDPTT